MKTELSSFGCTQIVKTIKVLSDDYNEMLICKNSVFSSSPKYEEIATIDRVINGQKLHDIYLLEPNNIYQINIADQTDLDWLKQSAMFLHTSLIEDAAAAGLLLLFSNSNQLYVKNCSINPIYIKKGTDIAVQFYLQEAYVDG